MVDLKVKLKGLKKELNLWKKEVFSTYTRNKKELVAEIERFDRYDDEGNLQEDLRVRRIELLSQLRNLEEKELAMVRQKAKVDWLKGVDTNSKFYHSRLRWRRAKSEIEGLWIDEVWCEDPTRVKSYVKGYFESRFGVNERFRLNLDRVCFKTVTNDDNDMLCSNISESEILDAMSQCDSSKCPGPDGYNFSFVKNNWDIVGEDIVGAIMSFQSTGFIPTGCNASFITLVPKKDIPSNLNEFRPISLVGSVYKIISKILANRIKKVLPSVIDLNQAAFLGGRGILDSILVANETVDYLKKEKKSGILVKVDFEKTYYSVDWKFLYYMMKRLGFNGKWIKWIKACMESATVLVLVNGSPTEEFRPKRGLRQGDPLAPFLFIIVAEGLSGLVWEAKKANLFSGVEVGRERVQVDLLQFADDTIFFL